MISPPATGRSPRRRVHPLWWVLSLFVAAVITGLVGGYGAAQLRESTAADLADWVEPERRAAAPPPTRPPTERACVRAFDVYSAMHNAYASGLDFSETRLTAAQRLRELADLYPEPDRTYLHDFADVFAADAQISGDDPDAVMEAVRREGDAWLEFIDRAC